MVLAQVLNIRIRQVKGEYSRYRVLDRMDLKERTSKCSKGQISRLARYLD